MQDAAEQLAASEKAREAFAENLRLATGRYEAGAADIIEMIDAQVQMTTAETSLVRDPLRPGDGARGALPRPRPPAAADR